MLIRIVLTITLHMNFAAMAETTASWPLIDGERVPLPRPRPKVFSRPATEICAGSGDVREMCLRINRLRVARGLPLVRMDIRLNRVAQYWASHMDRNKYFEHGNAQQRIDSANVGNTYGSENLALGSTVEQAMGVLMKSAAHYRNILNPRIKRVGIGRSGRYWVQDFTD